MAHVREQQHVADRRRIGQQHHQAVDADALPGRRWHAVLERGDVVGVEVHRLEVAGVLLGDLGAEALGLVLGVVELGEAVGDLAPTDEELEAVGDERVGIAAPRQRRDLGRVGGDEGRLLEPFLDGLLEDLDPLLAESPSAAPVASTSVGVSSQPKQTAAPMGARQRSAGSQRELRAPFCCAIPGSLQPDSPASELAGVSIKSSLDPYVAATNNPDP